MTKVILVRHGQTDYNKNQIIQGRVDIPLNDLGKEQARITANHFKDLNINLIISSPLVRAIETAEIIKSEINYENEIIIDRTFIERDFGFADGKSIPTYIDLVHEEKIEGLENSDLLKQRIINGLKQIGKNNLNKTSLIISHSHCIKAALGYLDGTKYSFKTNLKNCSITVLIYDEHTDQITIDKPNFNDYI